MPGLDKTGPQGQGCGTGRGLGRCNANRLQNNASDMPGVSGRGRGRSMERGLGNGRGCRGMKGRGRQGMI